MLLLFTRIVADKGSFYGGLEQLEFYSLTRLYSHNTSLGQCCLTVLWALGKAMHWGLTYTTNSRIMYIYIYIFLQGTSSVAKKKKK